MTNSKGCDGWGTYMGTDDASGMLLMAVKEVACPTVTSKVALCAGSSMQGNILRATSSWNHIPWQREMRSIIHLTPMQLTIDWNTYFFYKTKLP